MCRDKVEQGVSSLSRIENREQLVCIGTDFLNHQRARQSILKVYLDTLASGRNKVLSLPPRNLGSEGFLDNYDVLFSAIREEMDADKIKNIFNRPEATRYGYGTRLLLLSEGNLRKQKPSEDGTLRICVGVAFRHICLESTPPFRPETNNKNKNDKANIIAAANKQAKLRAGSGIDCVDVHLGAIPVAGVDGAGQPPGCRIYWTPAAMIPLQIVTLKVHTRCAICADYRTDSEGLRCSKNHLVCWEDCFDPYVTSAATAGAIGSLVDVDGNLKCPVPGCTDRYNTQHMINSKGSAKQMKALEDLRKTAHGVKEATLAREQQETQWRLENERIAKLVNLDERRAHTVKQTIVETVLSLRCPRCKAVFADFEGCFALTCARNICMAGFCAWCLTDCGADAHRHVLACPEGNRSYFGTKAFFEAHHKRKKEMKVREMVGVEPNVVQEIIWRILHKELSDLGIQR